MSSLIKKYLDESGLAYLWKKITNSFVNKNQFIYSPDGTAKAKNADKLDGKDSSYFATATQYTELKKIVDSLSSATHFIGVKEELPASANNGDIVVIIDKTNPINKNNGKEFIFVSNSNEWVELGDTTPEQSRLSSLETKTTTGTVNDSSKLENASKAEVISQAREGYATTNYVENHTGPVETAKIDNWLKEIK